MGRDRPAAQQSKGADKSRAELNTEVRGRDEAEGEMERISLMRTPSVSIGISPFPLKELLPGASVGATPSVARWLLGYKGHA